MPSFMKEYKGIGHERRRKTREAMEIITASSNPADLSNYKNDIDVFA